MSGIRHTNKCSELAKTQSLLALSSSLNASLVSIAKRNSSEFCKTNYVVTDTWFSSLWTPEVILRGSDALKFIYAEGPQAPESTWKLRSLFAPLDSTAALMLASAVCLYFLVSLLDTVANSSGISVFFLLGPICGQSWHGPLSQPWSFYFLLWSNSTWFLTTMYTTVLQSVVVVPEVLTLQEILDRNLTLSVGSSYIEIIESRLKTATSWLNSTFKIRRLSTLRNRHWSWN